MSQKRDFSDLEDGEVSDGDSTPVAASEEQPGHQQQQQPEPKRLKTNSSRHRHQHAGIDATWGQKSVFSGGDIKRGTTTIPDGLDDDFEDDSDAMAYLAAVRKEAHAIPHLLRAPTHQIGPQLPPGFEQGIRGDESDGGSSQDYEDGDPEGSDGYEEGEEDPVAWYEDGAYIARPLSEDEDGEYDPGQDDGEEDGDEQTAKSSSPAAIHAAYYRALLAQYASLRTLLHTEPPPDAYSRLPRYTPTEVRALTAGSTIATWGRAVRTADPLPLQLALMSKDSVLRLLRIIVGGKFLRAGHNIPERTSRWLWALLARLPERGQLDYMEIAWVRELGKRAVLLGTSLTLMAELRAEVDSGGLGVHEGFDASESEEDGFGAYDDTEVDDGLDKSLSKKDGKSSADDQENADEPESAISNPVTPRTNTIGQGKEAIPKAISKEEDRPTDKSGEVSKAPGGMDGVADSDHEDGEISDDGDVPMDLASNASSVAGDDPEGNLEDAKARLLAQVDAAAAEDELLTAEEERQRDARMNVRATVNMILTIVGEAYGQRDLLEFRDPFIGI